MRYPSDRYSVIVVADNCQDATAARAREAGARVIIRTDTGHLGKGYALAEAFRAVVREGAVDAVVVVDADTVVSENLLQAFARRLDAGAVAAQAEYSVANPEESWRTRLMAIAFSTTHTLRSRARERLQVSCGLHGNGMCFTSALLRELPYEAYSAVEDLEFAVRLAAAGHRVTYVGEAWVAGDMPSGQGASRTQRERWEGGRWAVVRAELPRLLAVGLRRRDRVALELALDLIVPPLSVLAFIVLTGLGGALLVSWARGGIAGVVWLWAACGAGLVIYVVRGWWLSGTGLRGLQALLHVPGYLVWRVSLPFRARTHPAGTWVRTGRGQEAR